MEHEYRRQITAHFQKFKLEHPTSTASENWRPLLEVPVSGIRLRVTRKCDTRHRFDDLDFGYGWGIGYQGVKIDESRAPGAGWALNKYQTGSFGLIPLFCVEPKRTAVLEHNLAFELLPGTLSTLHQSAGD